MIRKIIRIDAEKCNGCSLCADACHEGAIGMENGKAVLLRDDYCDGLGNCLPVCPTGAITFEEREALAYDEVAVKKNIAQKEGQKSAPPAQTQLNQWPVQMKLVPPSAPYFNHANLLIAADCTAFAYGDFHNEFMRNKVTLIGCPKLDNVDYSEKLTEIIKNNDLSSITVVRMEVPCCGGIEQAVKTALKNSGKMIPWQVIVLSTKGEILNR